MLSQINNGGIQPVIRGLKVPCSWATFNIQTTAEDSQFNPSQVTNFSGKARLRRDGLLFTSTNGIEAEWIIPSDIVKIMENKSWDKLTSESINYSAFADLEAEFFGIPLSNPNSLFSAPLTIQWDLTSRCNLKCKHCYADATSEACDELSQELVFRIVEEASHLGVMALHILGGEPFARKDLVEIIQHACQYGLGCHISSNGTLIKSGHAKLLQGLPNVTVDVSIDSIEHERHDWLRGQKGAYEKAIRGIRLLKEHGVRVGSTCTIYADTLDEMPLIAKQAVDLDLYRLQFLFVSPVGRAQKFQDQLLLSEDGRVKFSEQFKELVERYKDVILIDSPVVPLELEVCDPNTLYQNHGFWLTGCLAGIDKMAIRSDGTVVLCPQLEITHGNVKHATLKEIWAGLHTQRLEVLGQGCAICGIDGYCGGGCPAPDMYAGEIAPCYGRRPPYTKPETQIDMVQSGWCPTDCPFPCNLPCSLPCDCPTWCRSPCPSPCLSPCPSPCSCPTHCLSPCPLPCDCPTWCSSPCSCPTYCFNPCSCPGDCLAPCPSPCSFPCPLPR